ncbi:MAG: tetratricopeptide repeat protein [Treponema sp.]|nr:MAG: tetratricopeptide repeat protein [Treponema sp.]
MGDTNILFQGIDLYNQKKYSDALAFFLALPEDSGLDSQEIAYYLGLCYTKLKRYEDALLYLEQVVTGGGQLERVLQCRFILAVIYTKSKRKRLASFELNKLLESGYKPASVYASMAFIAWEQQEIDVALSYYEKSLELDENNVTSLNGLGYVLATENRDLTKALSCCKKAVQNSPDSAACLDSLGYVYYKLGLLKDARKYLEMAEQIDNDNEIIAEHIREVQLAGA